MKEKEDKSKMAKETSKPSPMGGAPKPGGPGGAKPAETKPKAPPAKPKR